MSGKLDRAYAQVPGIKCKGLCWGTCGAVPVSPRELRALRSASGQDLDGHPVADGAGFLLKTRGEELVSADRVDGKPFVNACPLLTLANRCSVHKSRPLICRLYGVLDHPQMACPHGCEREGVIDDAAAQRLMRDVGLL